MSTDLATTRVDTPTTSAASLTLEAQGSEIQRLSALTSLPFFCVDATTGVIVESPATLLPVLPQQILDILVTTSSICVVEINSSLIYYMVPIASRGTSRTMAIGYVLNHPDARPVDVMLAATRRGWSNKQLNDYLASLPFANLATVQALVELTYSVRDQTRIHHNLATQQDIYRSELTHTYAEIDLLHSLTNNLQISRSPENLSQLCLSRLLETLEADGVAILLHGKADSDTCTFFSLGHIEFDQPALLQAVRQFSVYFEPATSSSRKVVRCLTSNDPHLRHCTVIPITDGTKLHGWLVCSNVHSGRGLESKEANLLTSVAAILGTHVCNIELYNQQADLMIAFVLSMVSTLDAKDHLTRGHSERVAMIARCIGAEMQLPDDDLNAVYLSGLLHDIGKIGIGDDVLQKNSALTPEEVEHVKRHAIIGYDILKGVEQLQDVLPGIRNHHERFDGQGYPDGLAGSKIPLLAPIIAVADSCDAMTSDRPYRSGISPAELDAILCKGSGSQWDPQVVDAYLRVRQEIQQICASHSTERPEA